MNRFSRRRCLLLAFGLNLALAASSAAQPSVRQVLLLTSFERNPQTVHNDIFRTELSRRSPAPINLTEISIQADPLGPAPREAPVVDYLRASLAGRRLDLVVSVGGPAAAFAQKYRDQLFPTTPLLLAGLESRWIETARLSANDAAVGAVLDPAQVLDDLLRLLPDTTTVFAVIGASPFEDFWRTEVSRSLERFDDRVKIVWLNELSFADVLTRAAALPSHAALFYLALSMDAKGVLQSEERGLTQLHAVANAPIFGLYDSQLGRGIVGGPLLSIADVGRKSADAALRILEGESPANIKIPPQRHGQPTYDWRELQRWGISEARLPPGAIVEFRQPGLWDRYKVYVIGLAGLFVLQTILLAGLLIQRARRRRMEAALSESEQRFRLMANGAPVMVWTAAPDMKTDFFNSTVLAFTGLPLEQLLGDGWLDRIHAEDLDQCLQTYVPAFQARQPFQMEYRFRRADGEYRWVLDTGVPRYDVNMQFAGYIGSALDITERKQIEQSLRESEAALRRSYEQNQDLAGRLINAQEAERARIARDLHDDLSQQLAGVGILLSGLKRSLSRTDHVKQAEETVAALQERTATLAHSMRHLSHELHPGLLRHAGLVATLKQHCAEVGQHHGLAVTFGTHDDVDSLDFDVALCLYRVTQEALTNIVRHSQAQSAHIELVRSGSSIALRIVDDGVGFVAGESAARGLGLRSIDERVRLTRGTIRVDSQPGRGTSLLVDIPIKPRPELVHES